jgi:hypothetical protein
MYSIISRCTSMEAHRPLDHEGDVDRGSRLLPRLGRDDITSRFSKPLLYHVLPSNPGTRHPLREKFTYGQCARYRSSVTNKSRKVTGRCSLLIRHIRNGY